MQEKDALAACPALPMTEKGCAGLNWRIPSDERHIAFQPSVLLSASELASVSLELPCFFVLSGETWHSIALLRNGPNGKCPWIRPDGLSTLRRLPFLLRKHPFTLLPDGQKFHLGLWQDPNCVGSTGDPIYENGQLAENLRPMAQDFAKFVGGIQVAHTLASQLSDVAVLKPAPHSWGQHILMQVDEDRLRGLPGDQLEKLNKSGALGVAHAQMLSRHNLQRLMSTEGDSPDVNTMVDPPQTHAFFDALAEDLQAGAEFNPGALSP